MVQPYVGGTPGVSGSVEVDFRVVSRGGKKFTYLSQGKIIDGSKSGDIGNTTGTTDTDALRPGLLMGKITASGKYANSVIGTLGSASLAGATSLTVTAAVVTELVRRIGSSGTFILRGPPTANGTVAAETVTYSAASGTTITCSAVTAAFVAGSFIQSTDGSAIPLTFIDDGQPVLVSDSNGTRCDTPWGRVPIEGPVVSSQLIPWPTDTSLQAFIRGCLNGTNASTVGGPNFELDDVF